jgi:hypothetical protein
MINTDPTNYVEWGPNSAGIVVQGRLNPNEPPAVFRLSPGCSLHMKAHTGNCTVILCVYDN